MGEEAGEIIIIIPPKGDTTIKVQGIVGPGCKDLTKGIENALGAVVSDRMTAEAFLKSDESVHAVSIRQ